MQTLVKIGPSNASQVYQRRKNAMEQIKIWHSKGFEPRSSACRANAFYTTYILHYIHSIVIFHICMSLFESTLLSFCKPQSNLDLPTLRQGSRERKKATEQIKIWHLLGYIYRIYIYIWYIYHFICTFLTKAACCQNIDIVLHPTTLSYIYIYAHKHICIYIS